MTGQCRGFVDIDLMSSTEPFDFEKWVLDPINSLEKIQKNNEIMKNTFLKDVFGSSSNRSSAQVHEMALKLEFITFLR